MSINGPSSEGFTERLCIIALAMDLCGISRFSSGMRPPLAYFLRLRLAMERATARFSFFKDYSPV